ncbi:MAG TPA: tetratricopeptide repeat protein [Polyangia bacterium]|jgi:tetratricopeptide (TPR) repeat protein|nr:tetratricopeptide repeat protein [Polyangia bacterium]
MMGVIALAALLAIADAGAPGEARVDAGAATVPASGDPTPSAATRAGARADHALGLARLRAGRLAEATELFARASEGDPGNAIFATDYGFALGKQGLRAEAEAALRGAIEKDPRRFYAYVNLADLLADDPARWDRRDAIIADLDKGMEQLKDDKKGRFNLLLRVANFERAVGRTAAARARLEPLLAPDATPALSPAQRKRVLDLLDAVALDERAHALEAWPSPAVDARGVEMADAAARALAAGRADEARAIAETLLRARPTWERARFLRGRALEAQGRVDEAASELEISVNLAPSDAGAWRALGRLLALHGGALEADRADEALRNALALEPAWADLRALRDEIAHRRAGLAATASAPRVVAPSEHARALFQEAEEWIDVGDPAGLGSDLLDQALDDSPGYVAAAVTRYSLKGVVTEATVAALDDDGAGLWALVTGVRSVAGAHGRGKDGAKDADVDALTRPWIDRAVALDVQEARFARAVARAAARDRAGALDDLVAYVAREPRPAHLAEARAVRAGLAGGDGRPSPELLARIRLLEDRPDAALRALGATCAVGLPADRVTALGRVYEYAGRLADARLCYERAATDAGRDDTASLRLARLDARLPDDELRAAALAPLVAAAARGSAAASWALARRAAAAGDMSAALADVERALARPDDGDEDLETWLPAARAARARWTDDDRVRANAAASRRRLIVFAVAAALALIAFALARRRFGGWTLAAAVRRQPALFPEIARVIGELRHDVLKHRVGVLGLAADPKVDSADLARALLEPTPASAVVAAAHERLVQVARGQGLALRPLGREPTLGALAADLARAERLLAAPARQVDAVLAIDGRLRGAHADRLAALLQLGPRTRLGAQELAAWIAAVEASARGDGARWIAPALLLGELDVDFPVERAALVAIFSNLLRNAQAAAAREEGEDGHVIVRVERERDVTGRHVASLLVGDSAASALTLAAIEDRESGRGLAIVRDLVRQWRGHLVVRAEGAPFTKVVGACFPL